MSDEDKAVLYHQMFEHFELNPDADYRKGERVIKKAFLRVPITYGDESIDAFVPGDGSGNSWVPNNSRDKDDNVETVCLLSRQKVNREFKTPRIKAAPYLTMFPIKTIYSKRIIPYPVANSLIKC